jgi:hypothetical protein
MKKCGLRETIPQDGLESSAPRCQPGKAAPDDLEEKGSKINNKYENMNKALFGLADCNHRIIIISDNPMVRDKAEGEEKSEMSFRCGSNIKDTIEKLAGVEKLDKKLPEWQPLLILSIKRKIAESRVLEAINGNPELQERTAVIVSAAQLRSEGHNIPQTLALETRASDLWNERDKRPLKDLMECRYVLVHDLGDVFYFDNLEKQDGQRKQGKFGLYFRPYVGRPENNPDRYGKISGFVKILIVTIVKNILSTSEFVRD